MSVRLPEKDRVRSVVIQDDTAVATTVTVDQVVATHVFQDDVVVIGFQMTLSAYLLDAHLNADLFLIANAELTRQGVRNLPGALGKASLAMGWTGILSTSEASKSVEIMFPVGKGVEIDEGESLNIVGHYRYIGAGGTLQMSPRCIVWYTER